MFQRNILFSLLFLLAPYLCAQFNEDFSDGDFTASPVWQGTTDLFKVNNKLLLQANGTEAETSYLSTSFSLLLDSADTEWNFSTKLSFNPSEANWARFYLFSDRKELSDNVKGYYVQLGNSKDQISLYRADGDFTACLISGEEGRLGASVNVFHIKVKRTKEGQWTLAVLNEDSEWLVEGNCTDTVYRQSQWLGLLCTYTKSRKKNFYFDDISVVQEGTSVVKDSDDDKNEGEDELEVDTVSKDTQQMAFGSIVFSELMVNPSGAVGLPEIEYVEIYNRTTCSICLSNWFFGYGDTKYQLTDDSISSGDYLVLIKESNKELVPETWPVAYLPSFPRLLNTGKQLSLYCGDSLIHKVKYSDKWYGSTKEKAGGYSLESIYLHYLGSDSTNWATSVAKAGGTPGIVNSVARDSATPPEIEEEIIDSEIDEMLWIEQDYFIPSSVSADGYLSIFYSFAELGWNIRYSIFNLRGIELFREQKNVSDNRGTLIWRGEDASGSLLEAGIYILYAECIHASGKNKQYKFPIVISF